MDSKRKGKMYEPKQVAHLPNSYVARESCRLSNHARKCRQFIDIVASFSRTFRNRPAGRKTTPSSNQNSTGGIQLERQSMLIKTGYFHADIASPALIIKSGRLSITMTIAEATTKPVPNTLPSKNDFTIFLIIQKWFMRDEIRIVISRKCKV